MSLRADLVKLLRSLEAEDPAGKPKLLSPDKEARLAYIRAQIEDCERTIAAAASKGAVEPKHKQVRWERGHVVVISRSIDSP